MKQQINLTVAQTSNTLEKDLQHLVDELGIEGVEVLLHFFKTDKKLRNGVKDKVLKELKKRNQPAKKKASVFDLLG